MIEQAWNEYRGWAKRERSLEANARGRPHMLRFARNDNSGSTKPHHA
jgi:hypothetical protein